MKQNSFAYVQNQRIPNEFAHSIYVVKVCEAVQNLGYKTYLLLPKRRQPINFQKESVWSYYGIRKNFFKVVRFRVVESFIKPLKHQIITWLFAIQAVLYLAKERIEIVETIDREVILLLRILFWYQPKIIYDIHIDSKAWYQKILDWLIIPRVDLFVVNCQFFKDYYQRKGVSLSKIIVLPNGFDPWQYHDLPKTKTARKKLKLSPNKFIISYTGRFENVGGERCIPQMIKAVANLRKIIPICIVALGGPTNLVSKYRKMAKNLKLNSGEAVIRPQVKPHKVSQYLAASDVLCLLYPESSDHYRNKMSPLKAAEYMASKKPIIASDLSSIRQLLSRRSAYFVYSDRQKELEKTILDIWKNPKKAEKKAQKAYEFIKQFTWQNRQEKIFKRLYEISKA